MNDPLVIPHAEPFLFPGNTIACLLIHGFTGTPIEVRPIGEYLSKCGYTVLGIRLAGHATRVSDMARMHWRDWLASVEDGINLLRMQAEKVFMIGFSMGGILSLIAASRYQVSGAVALSAPDTLGDDRENDWRIKILPLIKWIQPEIKKENKPQDDDEGYLDHISYPVYSTRSIIELLKLQDEMRTCLPKIKVPVLLMTSKRDRTATVDSMHRIFELLTTAQKEMHFLEKSNHLIPLGPERDIVFRTVHNFIKKISIP